MSAGDELESLLEVMARLRGPDGCPWDREQTMASLRPYVLEEAHELVDAIDSGDVHAIAEELGDVLLEVVFVTQIAAEAGSFSMEEVARGIREKLVRRHPHVFADTKADDSTEALARWEAIKSEEKPERESLLDQLPRALPALARAAKLSKRAANGGFDWSSAREVREKIAEELDELDEAASGTDPEAVHEEIGDLLFAIASYARHAGTDAELALADANRKFERRFRHLERRVSERGKTVSDTSMEELERLWGEAKRESG